MPLISLIFHVRSRIHFRLLKIIVSLCSAIFLLAGCTETQTQFKVSPIDPPDSWSFVEDKHPCYLKINRQWRASFRVNCFQIDGDLYTHSNRFVEVNNWVTEALGRGSAWVYVVAGDPKLLVEIDGSVYAMKAELVATEQQRVLILKNRGYDPIPEAIRVYKLVKD